MSDPLVRFYAEWMKFAAPQLPVSSDFTRRISGQFELAVTRQLTQSLVDAGAKVVSRRRAAPDLLATTGPDARPLGVEVARWSRSRKNARNQINDAISTSVNARRALSSALTLELVVILLPVVGDSDWVPEDEIATRAQELLRRDDGVGYDDVFIGVVGPESHWIQVSEEGPRDAIDFTTLERLIAQGLRREKRDDRSSLPETPTVLLVGDEWGSGLGGISTFNRSLAIGLATNGFDVAMLLPSFERDELDEASMHRIALFRPDRVPGVSGVSALLAAASFGEHFSPDLIIGHGRKLGPYAFAVQQDRFPEAKRLHVVHTHAEALEAVKGHSVGESMMMSTDQKRRLEIELAESADLVAGVGPLLTRSIRQDLRGSIEPPEVIEIVPALPNWGTRRQVLDPPPSPEILIVSRTEDLESKGIEFAVRAMSLANSILISEGKPSVPLVIRGVKPTEEPGMRERLGPLLAHGTLVLRPYSSVGAELRTDYFAATTVLLPSRHEGFGLSAFEAIGAGIPVLVSARSGLGELIQAADATAPEVLPVDDASEELLLTTWANAIAKNVREARTAFDRAALLRDLIDSSFSWARIAGALRARL